MADAAEHTGAGAPHIVGHDTREASVRLILGTIVVLVISVVIVCLIVWGVFNWLKFSYEAAGRQIESPMTGPPHLPPEPRVEVHPFEELQGMRAREDEVLSHYVWVDPKSGVIHIPIEKAMDEVVATLPMRPRGAAGQNAAQSNAAAGAARPARGPQGGVSGKSVPTQPPKQQ